MRSAPPNVYEIFVWEALEHDDAMPCHATVNIFNLPTDGTQNRENGINDAAGSVRTGRWYCQLKAHYGIGGNVPLCVFGLLQFAAGLCHFLYPFSRDLSWLSLMGTAMSSESIGLNRAWGPSHSLASDTITSCLRCQERMVILDGEVLPAVSLPTLLCHDLSCPVQ